MIKTKNDYILDVIDKLKRINGTPEGGFFQSVKDEAYRVEAMRSMFYGLNRENQDKVLWLSMESLLSQVPGIVDKAIIDAVVL